MMMLLSIYSISVCQREVTIFFFITQLTNTSSDDDQKESIAQKNDDDDDDKVSVGFLPLSLLSVYSIFFQEDYARRRLSIARVYERGRRDR